MVRFSSAASLMVAAVLSASCARSDSLLAPSPELLQLQSAIAGVQALERSAPALLPADKWEDAMANLAAAEAELAKMPPDAEAAVGNVEGAAGDLETGFAMPDLHSELESDLRALLDDLVSLSRELASEALVAAMSRAGDTAA